MRKWIGETHGPRLELIRHFVPRFFDSDLVTSSADWSRVAAGALAMLVSTWILLGGVLFFKYKKLAALQLQARIPGEILADQTTIAGLAVCLTLLLVAVLWQSMYPTVRDCLALAALPVSPADVFLAKFSALGVAFVVYVLLLALPGSVIFAMVTGADVTEAFLTILAGCSLTFFGLIAAQGLLLNLLPPRLFERAMIWAQGFLAATALGAFPFFAWKAHAVAGRMQTSHSDLLLMTAVPPVVAVVIYRMSFHRYRRLLLEAPRPAPARRFDLLSRAMDLLVRNPYEQAAFAFLWNTIHRNRTHRLAVLIYCGLAAAWVMKSTVDVMSQSGGRNEFERVVFIACPLALILFTLLGMRQLFSLPVELRANWVFRIAEREGRAGWMNAVERFVLGCGVAPVVLAGTIFVGWAGGIATAIAWAVIAFLLGAIGFEYLFRHWRKLPFTCSYVPGKRPPIATLALFLGLSPFLLPVAWAVYLCATNPASFLVLIAIELGVWSLLRRARLRTWGIVPLRYEEQPESEVDSFDLAKDGTILAQEQFQRAWSDYLRSGPDVPILSPREEGETRVGRVWRWMTALPQDLRYALRMLGRSPAFGVTVVLTLGLGLGLNAAFFTVFNAFLLRPLAVRDPGSLAAVNFETRQGSTVYLDWQDYEAFSHGISAFSETAGSTTYGVGLDGRPAKIALVTSNYFTLLGAGASIGRTIQTGEDDAVLVLSHRLWQSRFGSDPRIIGRKMIVNGVPFEVIGVASPEFAGVAVGAEEIAPREYARYGVGAADGWAPLQAWNRLPGLPQLPVRGLIGRFRPGVGESQAKAMATVYTSRLTAGRPAYQRIARAEVESLDIPVTWTALTFSLPLLAAFGLTMLIPCANAANMMLARAMARQRELGTRLSLGASRGRVVRQLLTESFVLALVAGGVGLAMARVALEVFSRLIYATAPPTVLYKVRIPDFTIDIHVFVYMLIVAALTTGLFALFPAAQATRAALAFALRGEFGVFRASRLRDALVVGQVSGCAMLLVSAGVLLRGSAGITAMDRGYDATGVFGVANQSPEHSRALASILEDESWIETQAVMGSPLNDMPSIDAANPLVPGWHNVYYHRGSGEIFRLCGIPILRGRTFTKEESDANAAVAVVSERAAHLLWPGEDPIGKTVALDPGGQRSLRVPRFRQSRVIGVSRDIVSKVKDGGPRPILYFPDTLRLGTMVVVRGKGTPENTRRQLEGALARAPGAVQGARVVQLQETLDFETYPQQAASWLSTLLGAIALLLTITGMYGVMSYLVSQRTKEIGIRMALGATQRQVAEFILKYCARLAGAGLAFGAVLALGLLQYSASKIQLLINLYDIPAYSLSLGVVAMAALLAALGPTRRACAVDPLDALRAD
jgi:predicted permease